jgi:hypothetical protein
MADEVDYYAVLGLPPSADDATIRLAYRRLARRYHPDIAGDENLHLMQALNQAYQTLSDPERRRLYDASRPPPVDSAELPQQPQQRPPQQPHSPAQAARRPESVTASAGPLRRLAVFDDGQASAVVSVALAQGGAVAAVGHIDGQIALWNTTRDHPVARLALGTPGQAGTLSEVRISSDAALVMAWGFALGLAVWHVADGNGARRWSSQMNAPSGLMDACFLPHPAGLLRLALPDAPQALAESDPFYWADRGRGGTAIYTRPLPASGPIHPGWATPLCCYEASRQKQPETVPWQVRERVLSADGRRLLTFSTGRPEGRPRSQILRLWDIEARSHRGSVEPKRIAEVIEPDGRLLFPLATTPDLGIVALADFLGHMQVRSLDGRLHRSVATGPVPIDAFAALTSDASLLALAHGQRLDLWDTRTGRQLQSWQLTAPLTALSFAPTAHPVLALGLPNGLTEMWG